MYYSAIYHLLLTTVARAMSCLGLSRVHAARSYPSLAFSRELSFRPHFRFGTFCFDRDSVSQGSRHIHAVHAHSHTHTHTHTHTHARMHVRTQALTHIHIRIYTHMHTHTHARARTHTHTHTERFVSQKTVAAWKSQLGRFGLAL